MKKILFHNLTLSYLFLLITSTFVYCEERVVGLSPSMEGNKFLESSKDQSDQFSDTQESKSGTKSNLNALVTPLRAEEILNFWFGILTHPSDLPTNKLPVWLGNNPRVDEYIKDHFFQDLQMARRGELNEWRLTPRGRLALIIILDQFTRRIYPGQLQSISSDGMARGLVLEGIRKKDDEKLFPIERAFFYLPLEHSEDLEMQNLAIYSYEKLLAQSPLTLKPAIQKFLNFAWFHQKQIALFGRFPHRNAMLGRQSTPDELLFLEQFKYNSSNQI